jgi:dephospho-CoA kinase
MRKSTSAIIGIDLIGGRYVAIPNLHSGRAVMKVFAIFISGAPATGKTRLARNLSLELSVPCFNKDAVKEILVDRLGYKTREENLRLSESAFDMLLYTAFEMTSKNAPFILESNFRTNEAALLKELMQTTVYSVVSVFLKCDEKVLFNRFMEREASGERHYAHRSLGVKTYEDFLILIKDQLEFNLNMGTYFEIDTTVFDNLIFKRLLKGIKNCIA